MKPEYLPSRADVVFALACLVVLALVVVALICADEASCSRAAEIKTLQSCLAPPEDRPPVPADAPDPCAAIRRIESRLARLEGKLSKLGNNCEDLAGSCIRLTGLVDGSLRSFVGAHVEPAQIARAREGFERYQEAEGVGGE